MKVFVNLKEIIFWSIMGLFIIVAFIAWAIDKIKGVKNDKRNI